MAEAAQGTEGDTDGNYQTEVDTSNQNAFQAHYSFLKSLFMEAIPEEQNQRDSLNGNHDPNANVDTSVASSIDPQSAEYKDGSSLANSADGPACFDNSDADSSDLTMTESSTLRMSCSKSQIMCSTELSNIRLKNSLDFGDLLNKVRAISKSREDKIRIAREVYERERQRKISEILEAQRQAEEFRQKQQEDRRRKIDEMRRKDQERRKTVEDRRRRMQEVEEERRASLLRRSQARESRIDTMRSSRIPGRMAMSCVFGAGGGAAGDAALAALSRPRVAFGSSTPRDILSSLTPNRGARSSSRGGTGNSTDRSSRRRPLAVGQARSASVTPSSSFVAEKPGQVEKALSSGSATLPRRSTRSMDRRQAPPKSSSPDDMAGSNEPSKSSSQAATAPKLRSRSQGGPRPRPMSQVVTPAEMDSVFARLAQPKQRPKGPPTPPQPTLTDIKKTPTTVPVREKRGTSTPAPKKTPTPTPAAPPKTPAGRDRRRLPSPPKKGKTSPPPPAPTVAAAGSASPGPEQAAGKVEEADAEAAAGSEAAAAAADVEQQPAVPAAAVTESSEEDGEEPEPVAFDQMPSIMTQSMPAAMFNSTTKDITEDEYRLKIAEQRRLAREKLERERQEKEEARQARAAQERERREQARKVAEEARRRMEEEEERQRQEEEQARLEEEERARQRKEEERQAREAAEAERKQRLVREEEERLARKARLDKIMSRVKRGDDTPAAAPAGAVAAPPAVAVEPTEPEPNTSAVEADAPAVESEAPPSETPSNEAPPNETSPSDEAAEVPAAAVPPSSLATNGRGGPSPVGERESPSGSASPSGRKSSSPAEAPKFKSALLQSMLAGGRLSHGSSDTSLRRSSGSALSILQSSLAANNTSQEEVNVVPKGNGAETGAAGGVPHSFSLDALSAAASHRDSPPPNSLDGDARSPSSAVRAVSSQELDTPPPSLPNGDNHNSLHHPYEPQSAEMCEDEDVDGPALMSANIRTRLDEAKAASRPDNTLRENDNTRTAFEEILNLPHSTGHHDHLDGPVDPVSGAWFEQPPAPKQREQTAISDLLS